MTAAQRFLKKVWEASRTDENRCADVDWLWQQLEPDEYLKSDADYEEFYDLLDANTYTCDISGHTYFYGDFTM